jgi:motility quorum-sensing regulator / GCU-specific mRNA interferase toxin
MEKRAPHNRLSAIKAMVGAGQIRTTYSALAGAAAMGLDFDDIIGVVMALKTADFYKSMTTYADHQIWQDVYRPSTNGGMVYLKLTIVDGVLIVSFKEL